MIQQLQLLGIYPKDTDVVKCGDTCTSMFIAVMSTIAKLWKEPRCPSKDEERCVYIYNGILLSHQNGQIPTICFDTVGTGGYYAEWSKSIGEEQSSYGFTHTGNIKNSERNHRGKERKWVGKIRGDRTWETPNSGKRTRCSGRGGGGNRVTGWRALRGHLMGWALGVILYWTPINI